MDTRVQRAVITTIGLGIAVALVTDLVPAARTAPVAFDADDPAIWLSPDKQKCLILGTDKQPLTGRLYVFNLDGAIVQMMTGLNQPNNVDVERGFVLNGRLVDLAVVSEREARRLRIYAIDRKTGRLNDVSGKTTVFADRSGKDDVPMGIALHRHRTGQFYAVVSPKAGPKSGYLHCYRMVARGGKVDLVEPMPFGNFSGAGEIEAISIDPFDGRVYYADEERTLWCTSGLFEGRPNSEQVESQDYFGEREGLAFYETSRRNGYLLNSDQIDGGSRIQVYDRQSPNQWLCALETGADATDGIDATSEPAGPRFPKGFLVVMNSRGRNFWIFDWRDVERAISVKQGR